MQDFETHKVLLAPQSHIHEGNNYRRTSRGKGGGGTIISATVTSHLLIEYPIWIPGREKWTCESSYLKISSTGCRMPVSLLASMMLHTKRCAQMPRKYLTHFCSQGNTGPVLINLAKNAAKANWWILHTVVFGPRNENSNSYCGAHRPNNLFSIYRYRIS